MMTKQQSKKSNQFKYLVLIPVLVGMFFYSSCSESTSNSNEFDEKQIQTQYRYYKGQLKGFKGRSISYLDDLLVGKWPEKMNEIQFEDLSKNQQNEYNTYLAKGFLQLGTETKILKMPNGRNAIGTIMPGMEFDKTDVEVREISFLEMKSAPVFQDCEEGDFDCFFSKLDAHFTANFNRRIVDEIFVSPGIQKVIVDFSIDINGKITEIKTSASHIVIAKEVKRVIEKLPKMKPQSKFGAQKKTKYTLPFKIMID